MQSSEPTHSFQLRSIILHFFLKTSLHLLNIPYNYASSYISHRHYYTNLNHLEVIISNGRLQGFLLQMRVFIPVSSTAFLRQRHKVVRLRVGAVFDEKFRQRKEVEIGREIERTGTDVC